MPYLQDILKHGAYNTKKCKQLGPTLGWIMLVATNVASRIFFGLHGIF